MKPVGGSGPLISTCLAKVLQLKACTSTAGHNPYSVLEAPAIHRARMTESLPCRLHLPEARRCQRPRMIGVSPRFLNAGKALDTPRSAFVPGRYRAPCASLGRVLLDRLSAEWTAVLRVTISTSSVFYLRRESSRHSDISNHPIACAAWNNVSRHRILQHSFKSVRYKRQSKLSIRRHWEED
jgi:hypothetical protein